MSEPTINEMLLWIKDAHVSGLHNWTDREYEMRKAIRAILEREKARASELPEGWDWNDFKEWRNARTND